MEDQPNLDTGLLTSAIALVPLALAIRAYNHTLMLNRPLRVVGFSDAFALTIVGVALSMIVPLLASDILKARWGLKAYGSPESMVVSTALDKLTSLSAVALMGVAGAVAIDAWVVAVLAAVLAVCALVPFVVPDRMPWRRLVRFLAPGDAPDPDVIRRCARVPKGLLAWSLVVSLLGWVATYATTWLCLRAVGADVSVWTVAMLAPIATVMRLVPVSVGGIGVGEATLAAMLAAQGVSSTLAAKGVLISMLLLVIAPGAVGILLLALRGSRT